NSFENTYTSGKLSSIDAKKLIFLPMVVTVANGKKVCITESDLEQYPGMYLTNQEGKQTLKAVFAPYPKEVEQGGHNNLQFAVKQRESYLAKATNTKNLPWRAMVISTQDKQLTDSDMTYKLASPSRVEDVSWIKPGKVAWDWWNDWNVYGVDFKAGINNATYKYYIDFASTHHIGYVILDEGWAVNKQADLMQVIPEINIQELVDYGKTKNVGIILWAGYSAMNKDIEGICKHYSAIGVKGFKVDFMDRDDQQVVDFYYDVARIGAKYKLMIDFHGAFKPTGLQRTYPNVINVEGVFGLEQLKWADNKIDMVAFDVTIPFIRMVAGPMDYTQGAMRNATKNNFRPINSEPMSQGTRCHQLAEYIVFEAPFNMLCDNPSNYMRELESTKFIAEIPTVWDNTIALEGKMGEYVAIARKKGNDWYVGAMTNWDEREITVDLSFLGTGDFLLEVFRDGINANRAAQDYKYEMIALPADKKLKISMASGGGYAARVFKLTVE
ncbi:MAG TPA: glycoside hydrolase family 97 catalytic domain-containing protein, partial [Cyclobacteriaceae bacterium]|nr:glycoside hydrolase family 97 catalytic domain-containing protein [Cyclobacteriaceae bacterium]